MKILFVCTGNTCRSPMAEGILNQLAKEKGLDIRAESAGIFAMAGEGAAANAIEAMKRIDIDISSHQSSLVRESLVEEVDLVLTMSQGHKEKLISYLPHLKDRVYLLNEYAFDIDKDLEDPYGQSIEYYEKARDEIYRAIEEILDKKL